MKISELRIGQSWIQCKRYKESIIFNEDIISVIHDIAQHYEPIALTPEILNRFGFIEMGTGFVKENCNYFEISKEFQYFNTGEGWTKSDMKYLHKLQNLFFALAGFELNDVVAYNYYKEKCTELKHKILSFEWYLDVIENRNKKVPFLNSDYSLGDMPQNLWIENK